MRGYIIAGIIALCWIGREGQVEPCKTIVRHEAIKEHKESDSLTRKSLRREIDRLEIDCQETVFRQAMLETGGLLCSDCSLDRNNLFGFATDKGYINFKNWRQSVAYYAAWQVRKGYTPQTDYYEFLRQKWVCEDIDHYIEQLKNMKPCQERK